MNSEFLREEYNWSSSEIIARTLLTVNDERKEKVSSIDGYQIDMFQ